MSRSGARPRRGRMHGIDRHHGPPSQRAARSLSRSLTATGSPRRATSWKSHASQASVAAIGCVDRPRLGVQLLLREITGDDQGPRPAQLLLGLNEREAGELVEFAHRPSCAVGHVARGRIAP